MSSGTADPVTIPGVFIGQSDGAAIRSNAGLSVSASSIFDGWGYLHVINNTGGDLTVPTGGMASGNTKTVASGFELGYYAPAEAVEEGLGTDSGDLTMHNIEADPLTQGVTPSFNEGPRMFVSWYSLGMRALEYRPGHYHANLSDEGSYSENVHEVGRWIAEDGSNFWGVHVDELEDESQIILASDRNTCLLIFTFSCETRTETGESVFYCDPESDGQRRLSKPENRATPADREVGGRCHVHIGCAQTPRWRIFHPNDERGEPDGTLADDDAELQRRRVGVVLKHTRAQSPTVREISLIHPRPR